MADRRSMNQALHMTPEKVAFINDDPRSKTPAIEPLRTPVEEEREETASDAVELVQGRTFDTRQNQQPVATQARATIHQATPHIEALVPLTTRLQPATASALKRAYLERKLSGDSNATQQRIVEEALQHWLEQQGYLVYPA